jgi:hypothetical protein
MQAPTTPPSTEHARDVPHGLWLVAAFGIGDLPAASPGADMDVAVALDRADEQTSSRPCADVDSRGLGHEPPTHRAAISARSGEIV